MRFLECLKSAGKILRGNNYLWSMMKKSSVSRMQRFMYLFSDSVLCLGKVNQNPASNAIWEEKLSWFKDSPQYTTSDTIDGEPMEFEWNISQDSLHWSLSAKSKSSWTKWSTQHNSKDELSSCRSSMTSYVELKTMNRNVLQMPHLSVFAKRFPARRWSFLGPGSEKKWYSSHVDRPQGEVVELMVTLAESGHPVLRATSPLSRGVLKSKGGGKLSMHFCADGDTIETVFPTIISDNQLSIYGAVSDLCEEYSTCQTRSGRLVVAEQSDPFFAPADLLVTTRTPSIEIPAQENFFQKYRERVENLPQPDRVIKICTDTGFLKTVEVGQYFMTKHTDEFSEPVTCRGYTLTRVEKSIDPKERFEGTSKLDPCWKSQQATCKVNMEWKSELNLWTKTILTCGSEFLMASTSWSQTWSTKSTTTTSRKPLKRRRKYLRLQADQRLKQNLEDLPLLAHLQELYLFVKEYGWYWTRTSIRSSVPSGKRNKHSSSTRRSTSRRRWSDRILETERWSSEQTWILSMLVWWCMEEQDGRRRRQQEKISILYWPVTAKNSISPSSSRSFRTQSHWSYTSGQCVNSEQFLRVHLSYWMCDQFTLHHEFWIDTGRTKFQKGQTDGILHGCESHE